MKQLVLPAYDFVVKAAHAFNVLDARSAIGVTERQRYILRVRTIAREVCHAYHAQREALGFPLLEECGDRRGVKRENGVPRACRSVRCRGNRGHTG